MQSTRSSRQLPQQRRKKPYARRPPPHTSSMLTTIKNIVTAPLSWFAANDDFEQHPGKRRRATQAPNTPEVNDEEPSQFRVKRMRLHSPEADVPLPPKLGYLDPPSTVFSQQPVQPTRAPQLSSRASAPSFSSVSPAHRNSRHTVSPPGVSEHRPQPLGLARTMSMDLPHRRMLTPEAALVPLPISRDVSMELSPHRPPFRMRTGLTPQLSAPDFGPDLQRRERHPSEPPPLTALMSNPVFVKPPPFEQARRETDSVPVATLGSLAQSQRSAAPLVRSRSSLIFGTESVESSTRNPPYPMNAAERALRELEAYRTPLVPTRLKSTSASALPELFQVRDKTRHIIPMSRKGDTKPRLGYGEKMARSKAKGVNEVKEKGAKPYTGVGDLKKLLARRRREEEEDEKEREADRRKEEEEEEAMADDSEAQVRAVLEDKHVERKSKFTAPIAVPVAPSRKIAGPPSAATLGVAGGRQPSSLRAGRAYISVRSMQRAAGPMRTKNRFSAREFEDEDILYEEDVGVSPVVEEKPEEMEITPRFEDRSTFSFALEVTSAPAPVPAPQEIAPAKELPIAALPFSLTQTSTALATTALAINAPAPLPAAPAVPPTPALPTFALLPPTPEAPEVMATAVPPTKETGVPNFFATSGIFGRTGVAPPAPVEKKGEMAPPAPAPTVPSVPAPAQPLPSAAPVPVKSPAPEPKPVEPSPAPPVSFAPPTGFSFGAPPSPTPAAAPSALPFSLVSKRDEAKPTETAAPAGTKPLNLFGGVSTTSPLGPFGGPTPSVSTTAIPSAERPKPAFSFGAPAPTRAVPAKPVAETAKPLFEGTSGFSFAQSTGAFSFGTPAVSPTGTNVAASKPFSFGTTPTTKPAQPVTPPQAENEMRMDESPTRNGNVGMDLNGGVSKETPQLQLQVPSSAKSAFGFGGPGAVVSAPPGGAFSFGAPAQTRATSTGGAFSFGAAKAAESSTSSGFGMGTSPFTFGAATKPAETAPSTGGFSFGPKAAEPARPPSSGFSFGQPAEPARPSSSGFAFGAQPAQEPARPSSSGFGFGQPSTTAPSFPFGGTQSPSTQATANLFGQPPQNAVSSAPASPAFNQPSPFSFGSAPTSATATAPPAGPFGGGFGAVSQPASPAVGTTPFAFGATANTTPSSPASPFGAPPLTPAAAAGGSLFTMGAPSSMATAMAHGNRPVKRLPTRRGGKR
ncbi:hypothetical protein EW146_g4902 [Bondarzewia mesenterica]|uniref:Uncharacterized protein n=1 Tax=Bondarzewia mesenterica TaxID=1095465 RepID=A0A4S4LT55_9AGAM|nr:hypothetical protein EW146_g4902 [Bondarzewia mesenterica]